MRQTTNTINSNWALWSIATIALAFSIASISYVMLRKQDHIVSVDAAKLITQYKGVEAARKSLQVRNQGLQANLDTLKGELQASITDYNKNKAKAGRRELKLMEEVLQSRQRNLANYQQAIQDQTKKQNEELAERILTKVNDYVKRYGKKNGYDIILAANQFGNVAYANETADITDQVLAGLNDEYTKSK